MHAEIISIGDEITSGQLLDTNSQWLSQRLEDLGVRALYHTSVGDNLHAMVAAFRGALERSDIVIATGGLGPTADDLTREAIASATRREMVLCPDALEFIRRLFARRKRNMPQRNEVQALFPAGSRVIPNPHGTAPGIDLTVDHPGRSPSRIFALPGVPAEMREMWHRSVAIRLREAGAGHQIVQHRKIKCFGAGESQIEAMLPDLIRRGRYPRVGINASKATIILRVTAEGATRGDCDAAIEPTAVTIRQCLGNLVFGEGEDELQHAVAQLLRHEGKCLATAEWGTGGLIAEWLGELPEAGSVYSGGVVVCTEVGMTQALKLPPAIVPRYPAVSGEVAAAMAEACRGQFGSDYALAVSPFPPLDPEAAEPASVFLAVASAEGTRVKSFPYSGHPALLKIYFAKHALNLVRLGLLGGPAHPL